MTPFIVDWTPSALRDLANIWLQAANRQAVTAAQAAADRLLAADPIANGRHLIDDLYRLTVSPLRLYYTADATKKLVKVTDVFHGP